MARNLGEGIVWGIFGIVIGALVAFPFGQNYERGRIKEDVSSMLGISSTNKVVSQIRVDSYQIGYDGKI